MTAHLDVPLRTLVTGGLNGEPPPNRSTWTPVDLTAALLGIDIEPPVLLARTDGIRLLYEGRTHQFAGESESCKTWAALIAAAEVLAAGGNVLWIDFEDDERGIVARLRALLVDTTTLPEHFTYIRPDEPLLARDGRATAGGVDFGEVITGAHFDLAVIDGVTEAMTTEDLDLMSNGDAAKWMRRLPKRIATETGAAVVCIDHVTKATDNRRYALGGQHKLAGLTGAAYRFDVVRRLSRAQGVETTTGTITVTVMKDRPGHVRTHAAEDQIGVLELTSYGDGTVTAAIVPPGAASMAPDLAVVTRIAEYLSTYDGASKNRIENDVEGRADTLRAALRWMADPVRAWIRIEKVGASHRHHLTDQGRTDLL